MPGSMSPKFDLGPSFFLGNVEIYPQEYTLKISAWQIK